MTDILTFKKISESAKRQFRQGSAYPDGYEECMDYGVYRGTKKLFELTIQGTNIKTTESIKTELAIRSRVEIERMAKQDEIATKPIDAPTESEFTMDIDNFNLPMMIDVKEVESK